MSEVQEVMDKFDPSIRVEVGHGAEGIYVHSFDTTVTPNHFHEWIIPLVTFEEFRDSWKFTEGQAQAVVSYWNHRRQYREEDKKKEALRRQAMLKHQLDRIDHEIKQLEKEKEKILADQTAQIEQPA